MPPSSQKNNKRKHAETAASLDDTIYTTRRRTPSPRTPARTPSPPLSDNARRVAFGLRSLKAKPAAERPQHAFSSARSPSQHPPRGAANPGSTPTPTAAEEEEDAAKDAHDETAPLPPGQLLLPQALTSPLTRERAIRAIQANLPAPHRFIPTSAALTTFAFEPPEDTFSEDEHARFVRAVGDAGKDFERIAAVVGGGRSTSECIRYWYAWKNDLKREGEWRGVKRGLRLGRERRELRGLADVDGAGDGDRGLVVLARTAPSSERSCLPSSTPSSP
ncbi:uncharacterized protein K452DRAFT_311971 [Aplosporella prunicola CBS 121167]|uniref:SANT domain-containing protein n=1 Tax=Aplosporella prunicola CBS 121167 TaxID=1176127 RepID=A0A6A6B3Q4_9PEZI|nr:uncharacterized protein K452DRAFT_311971 [Aplosporella prunicola CBS 121167]KAF2137834.1 hypothetical protein K452DRAFT_311971 [Aplosporella prunicola CBS 121167]